MPLVRSSVQFFNARHTRMLGALVVCGSLLAAGAGYRARVADQRATAAPLPATAQVDLARGKIKHIVFFVLENRTFDSLFGRYPGADGATSASVAGKGSMPLVHGPLFGWHDVGHDRPDILAEIDGGKMDGFAGVTGANLYGDQMAFWQYDRADLPNFWSYADHFTLGDHMFSAQTGPTFPNRLVSVAAQAGGVVGNPHYWAFGWGCDSGTQAVTPYINGAGQITDVRGAPCFTFPTLADALGRANRSWNFYGAPRGDLGYLFTTMDAIRSVRSTPLWKQHVKDEQTFAADAQAGRLPFFSWITPRYQVSAHPPFSIASAEDWVVAKLNALMRGPDWSSTAVFITFDDSGGFYDHVRPPVVDRTGYGLRVPLLIVSPYAKHGYISHTVYSYPSILKTAEEIAGLPPLTGADRAANDTLDSFDFTQRPAPPLVLPLRNLPPGPSLAQYDAYLRAAYTQTVQSLFGLSMDAITRLHATRTLAQIAAERKVSLDTLTRALGDDVNNMNFIMQHQGFITSARNDALRKIYAGKVAALLQAAPGTPLTPLLGTAKDAALLPSPAAFSGGKTARAGGAGQGTSSLPAIDPS